MKKLLSLLLAIVMILSLAACGGGTSEESSKTETSKTETSKTETSKAETSKAETSKVETSKVETSADTETLELSLFSIAYDPTIWTCDQEELYDYEDYASAYFILPEGTENIVATVEITLSIEDQEDFRSTLDYCGIDAYEYVVNNTYPLSNIGGIDCLSYEGSYWGDPLLQYMGRDESASATFYVEILGDYEDPRVQELLSTLTLAIEDIGNVDAPWPWDGEPFSAVDASEMVGTYTINSQWVPFTDCILTNDVFNHAAAAVGDKAYILTEGVLKQYSFDGTSLTYDQDLAISGAFEYILADSQGTIWISGFMEPTVTFANGVQTGSFEGPDFVSIHPSGEWGINWFSGPECEKITFANGAYTSEFISFSEVSTIFDLFVDEDYIYVCGSDANTSEHNVFMYDADGTLQMVLKGEDGDGLGSISYITQTVNGFLGLDGNMREIILWAADGTYIGAVDDRDLFGTSYPWFCSGSKLSDGSILVIMTDTRSDESAKELIAFTISVN
jgi:hypothetical protein